MKIVFFGTPPFAATILQKLIEEGHQIEAVITRRDKPKGRKGTPQPSAVKGLLLARYPDIPLYQPINPSKEEFAAQIASFSSELFVVAAYGHILRSHILDHPKFGAINVHASLLPKYRGAAPIQRAIMEGEEQTGVTIMQMVLEMDAGDVLQTSSLQLDQTMTGGEVTAHLATLGAEALCEVIERLERGVPLTPIAQEPSAVTFAPKILKEDCLIDWNRGAKEICAQIRALAPQPGAYCYVTQRTKQLRLKVFSAEIVEKGEAGTLTVPCRDGVVRLTRVQLEGKEAMRDRDLLRGTEIRIIVDKG